MKSIKQNQILLKKPGKTKAFFICLIIASFLWLIHALNMVYTVSFKIPVSFINLPQNKKPLEPLPQNISLDVKASGLKLSLLYLDRPYKNLMIDFNKLQTSNRNQSYILSPSKININSVFKIETQIKHISPDTLYFTENSGYQKSVPVKIPLSIKCLQGYGYLRPSINPDRIIIWGDTSEIKKIDTIYTSPINLYNLSQSIYQSVSVIKPNNQIVSNTNEVNLQIQVSKLIEHQLYLPVINSHENTGQKISIFPSRVKVTFTALQNQYDEKDSTLFMAMIDYQASNNQRKKYPVFLSKNPSHTTILNIVPKEVEILIFK